MSEIKNGLYDDIYKTLKGVAIGAIGKDQVMAISARAKRSVSMYRVLISSSIQSEELATNITRYIECMCAIFTLISTGYNPLAKTNGDIDTIINNISAENLDLIKDIRSMSDKRIIMQSVERAMKIFDESIESTHTYKRLGPVYSQEAPMPLPSDTDLRQPRHLSAAIFSPGSNEAYIRKLDKIRNAQAKQYIRDYRKNPLLVENIGITRPPHMSDNEWIKYVEYHLDSRMKELEDRNVDAQRKADIRRELSTVIDRIEKNKILIEDEKQQNDIKNLQASARYSGSNFITKLDDINSKAAPTVLTLDIATPQGLVKIPLAIKANMYGLREDEMRLLLESVIEGKVLPKLRKIKWKSGEITTLQYLFNTDLAEKEKKLYRTMGRNPWYINLMTRRAASRGNFLLKNILKTHNARGSDYETAYDYIRTQHMNLKGDIPPTATLVASVEDLTHASGLDRSRFLNNEVFIKKIMKELFLLCFCVVDTIAQQCYFYFSGYGHPFVYSYDDLAKSSKNTEKLLAESVHKLATRI